MNSDAILSTIVNVFPFAVELSIPVSYDFPVGPIQDLDQSEQLVAGKLLF
jgi:hypothetical protein